MRAFLDGPYIIAFSGTDQGIIHCDTAKHMKDTVHNLFPNPGCPHREVLLNPSKWQQDNDNEFPYYVEIECEDERGASIVRIYRVREL